MASGWIYGLVPPSTVDAEEDCGDRGVAVVETQLSFLNQLVSGLTLGIYTPMSITVICGEGSADDENGAEGVEDGTADAKSGKADDEGSPRRHP